MSNEEKESTGGILDGINMKVSNVWCKGCNDYRPVNSNFAKYLANGIEQCSLCRDKQLEN